MICPASNTPPTWATQRGPCPVCGRTVRAVVVTARVRGSDYAPGAERRIKFHPKAKP